MNIYFYNNNSENNVLNKSLSNEYLLTGFLRDSSDIRNPTIKVNTNDNIIGYNYCYIPKFNRYYFITDITIVRTGIYDITLKCDVLMSFRNEILESYAIINSTTTDKTNKYLSSDIYKSLVKDFTSVIQFPSGLLDSGEYILITAGGNS